MQLSIFVEGKKRRSDKIKVLYKEKLMFYTLLNSNQNLGKKIVQYYCSYLLYCGKLESKEKFNTVINELKTFYIEKSWRRKLSTSKIIALSIIKL